MSTQRKYLDMYWCTNCNDLFINEQSRHPKFCSRVCRQKFESKRNIIDCVNCGQKMKSSPYRMKIGQGKLCSKKCQTEHCVGEKASGWKGGITPINMMIRESKEYKEWRIKVYKRDKFRCTECKNKPSKGNRLNADHIKPFSIYPELRFKISNGRLLCEKCHRKTDSYGGKLRKNYNVKSFLGTV